MIILKILQKHELDRESWGDLPKFDFFGGGVQTPALVNQGSPVYLRRLPMCIAIYIVAGMRTEFITFQRREELAEV